MAAPNFLPFKVPRPKAGSLRASAKASRERESGVKRAIDRADQVLSSLEARAAGFDRAIKALQARKKHALVRATAIEERVIELMSEAGLDKLVGNRATLSKRANALSLVVDDLNLIPAAYLRTKTITETDKVAIKVALDRGVEISGVHLTQSISLIRST
jgi:Siphovirus Gp157